MSGTGIAYNERFLAHKTGAGHPERPDRLRALVKHLTSNGLWKDLHQLIIDSAPVEWICRVHTAEHFKFVRDSCATGREILDEGDTHVCPESFEVALLAAGAVIAAVDAVMTGVLTNAFCAVRPPGHHAESSRAMGFCLFNNVAIGARYALENYRLKKVAIIDWDVHHGNGTQEIFYADKRVFYISTHQFPYYPGTGSREERGTGDGTDYTLNIPLPAGSGSTDYLRAFEKEILPAIDTYRPELIFISAGFDAHKDDPLANMKLTEDTYGKLTELVVEAAESVCQGRIVSVLEGGYNLDSLSASVEAHLEGLSHAKS